MTPELLSELRHIDWELPDYVTPKDAAKMLRPRAAEFVRGSFWRVLIDKLPFARSEESQEKITAWLFSQRIRAKKAGKPYPPKPIVTKPARLPLPSVLKQV